MCVISSSFHNFSFQSVILYSYWISRRMQIGGSDLFTFNYGRMCLHCRMRVSNDHYSIASVHFVCTSSVISTLYCYTKFVSIEESPVSLESIIVPSDRSTVCPILPTNVSNGDYCCTAMFCLGSVSRILFKIDIERSCIPNSSCILLRDIGLKR